MLFDALAVSKSHIHLKELRVLRHSGVEWLSFPAITSTKLALLFPLSQLTTLEITIDNSVILNDEDLRSTVTAWPNLHTFRIVDRRVPLVTLKGLLRFASRLPLEEITLGVDCTKLLTFAETGSIIPCPTLRHLNLCRSPVLENINHIVAPFTLAFPSLSQLSTTWELGDPGGEDLSAEDKSYCDRWRAVRKRLVPLLHENRIFKRRD